MEKIQSQVRGGGGMHQFQLILEPRCWAYRPRIHPLLDWILDPPLCVVSRTLRYITVLVTTLKYKNSSKL